MLIFYKKYTDISRIKRLWCEKVDFLKLNMCVYLRPEFQAPLPHLEMNP